MPSGVFPITSDYGHGRSNHPGVAIHQFGSGNAKIEHCFLLGNGTTAYTCRFANEPLSWQMVADLVCSVGVALIEIPASNLRPDHDSCD